MKTFPIRAAYGLCFSTLLILTACKPSTNSETKEEVIRPVKLITVKEPENRMTLSYPASVEAANLRKLSFQVPGQVKTLHTSEGMEIKKGDILAEINDRDLQSQLSAAEAQFDNAKEEYERAVRLEKEDAIAKAVLDQRKAQFNIAEAALESAQKAMDESILTSPLTGVVSKVDTEELSRVQAGEPIITVFSTEVMQVQIDLPADVVARVNQRTDKETVVVLDAAPDSRIPAEFLEATLEADGVSQTFAVTFKFSPPEELLILPGMSASVYLTSSSVEKATSGVEVPVPSIFSDGSSNYVWVYDENSGTVSKREVTVTDSIGPEVIVSVGLSDGDIIVGAGASYLSEGLQVRPWE